MLWRLVVVLLAGAVLPGVGEAGAATLIEGTLRGEALRVVVAADGGVVAVTLGERRSLVALAGGRVYRTGPDGRTTLVHARYRPAPDSAPDYEIAAWGPGPMVAGHGSVYHVVTAGGRICTEVLVSGWMQPFVDPAIRALAVLEQLDGEGADAPCRPPFATLAAAGWPLMVGAIDHPVFKTAVLRFDHQPAPEELALPGQLATLGPRRLDKAVEAIHATPRSAPEHRGSRPAP